MAQDGPHDHQAGAASDGHSFAPTPAVTCTLTLRPSAENDDGGSSTGNSVVMDANKGKDVVVPDVHEEERGSAGSSHAKSDGSKGKLPAAEVAAADPDTDAASKGKSMAADDDDSGELKVHIIMERERRKRMKDMFNGLQALMPHVPEKSDKATIVAEAISYIKDLENTVAVLEKLKQDRALARQAAAEAAASRSARPQTAQGMAALSSGLPHAWGGVPPAAAAPPPPRPALPAAAGPVGFQTWAAPNVVLSVLNSDAIINMCTPRRPRILTLVVSVLSKHGIDVVTAQIAGGGANNLFVTIRARVKAVVGGANPPAEDVYKLAVSEIMVWLSG